MVVVITLFLLLGSAVAQGNTIVVGQGLGGWTLGVKYAPINAVVGDTLSFTYQPNVHDVWSLPSSTCNFAAPGAKQVAQPADGSYITNLTAPGTYYYACSFTGHCDAGQLLVVNVSDKSSPGSSSTPSTNAPAKLPSPAATTANNGSCAAPVSVGPNEYMVSCISPALSLSPGDNIFPDKLLPNPYPDPSVAPLVLLQTIAADVVDSNGTSIPLDELYLHHIFGDIRFVPAEGAEFRRSTARIPLPSPFYFVVNTTQVADTTNRYANIHMIRTTGVASDAIKPCIECWCKGSNPISGSIGCCAKCPSNSTEPPKDYHVLYNVTYSIPTQPLDPANSVTRVALDVHGGVEYSTQPNPDKTGLTMFNRTYAMDYFCPQTKPFSLIKCYGHQHIGGRCMYIVDHLTGDVICESCPTYGNGTASDVGNEGGYLVGMNATTYSTPYTLQPGQLVTVSSAYAGDQPYAGVMSLFALTFKDFDARPECKIDYSGFEQPPDYLGANSTAMTAAALVAEAQAKVNAVPPECKDVRSYIDSGIMPCLSPAADIVTMSSMGPGMSNISSAIAPNSTCCASTKKSQSSLRSLYSSFSAGTEPTNCVCALGELLLFSTQTGLYDATSQIATTCNGNSTVDATVNSQSIYVFLNSFFAPKCPNILAQMNAAVQGSIPTVVAASPTPALSSSGLPFLPKAKEIAVFNVYILFVGASLQLLF